MILYCKTQPDKKSFVFLEGKDWKAEVKTAYPPPPTLKEFYEKRAKLKLEVKTLDDVVKNPASANLKTQDELKGKSKKYNVKDFMAGPDRKDTLFKILKDYFQTTVGVMDEAQATKEAYLSLHILAQGNVKVDYVRDDAIVDITDGKMSIYRPTTKGNKPRFRNIAIRELGKRRAKPATAEPMPTVAPASAPEPARASEPAAEAVPAPAPAPTSGPAPAEVPAPTPSPAPAPAEPQPAAPEPQPPPAAAEPQPAAPEPQPLPATPEPAKEPDVTLVELPPLELPPLEPLPPLPEEDTPPPEKASDALKAALDAIQKLNVSPVTIEPSTIAGRDFDFTYDDKIIASGWHDESSNEFIIKSGKNLSWIDINNLTAIRQNILELWTRNFIKTKLTATIMGRPGNQFKFDELVSDFFTIFDADKNTGIVLNMGREDPLKVQLCGTADSPWIEISLPQDEMELIKLLNKFLDQYQESKKPAQGAPPEAAPPASQEAPAAAPSAAPEKTQEAKSAAAQLSEELSKSTGVKIKIINQSFNEIGTNLIRQRTPLMIDAIKKALGGNVPLLNDPDTELELFVPTEAFGSAGIIQGRAGEIARNLPKDLAQIKLNNVASALGITFTPLEEDIDPKEVIANILQIRMAFTKLGIALTTKAQNKGVKFKLKNRAFLANTADYDGPSKTISFLFAAEVLDLAKALEEKLNQLP